MDATPEPTTESTPDATPNPQAAQVPQAPQVPRAPKPEEHPFRWVAVFLVVLVVIATVLVWFGSDEPDFVVDATEESEKVDNSTELFEVSIKANTDVGDGTLNYTVTDGDGTVLLSGERVIRDHINGEKKRFELEVPVGSGNQRPYEISIKLVVDYEDYSAEDYNFDYKKDLGSERYWKQA